MDYTVIIKAGERLGFGFVHIKNYLDTGEKVFDSTFFQNGISVKEISAFSDQEVAEEIGMGKSFWEEDESLLEAVNTIRDFWLMEPKKSLPMIPKIKQEEGIKRLLESDNEMLVVELPFNG